VALRRQNFSSLAPAIGQYFTSIGCCHSGAKSVNLFSAALIRLIGTFHDRYTSLLSEKEILRVNPLWIQIATLFIHFRKPV
jgi:hypothetical protein